MGRPISVPTRRARQPPRPEPPRARTLDAHPADPDDEVAARAGRGSRVGPVHGGDGFKRVEDGVDLLRAHENVDVHVVGRPRADRRDRTRWRPRSRTGSRRTREHGPDAAQRPAPRGSQALADARCSARRRSSSRREAGGIGSCQSRARWGSGCCAMSSAAMPQSCSRMRARSSMEVPSADSRSSRSASASCRRRGEDAFSVPHSSCTSLQMVGSVGRLLQGLIGPPSGRARQSSGTRRRR